MSEGPVLIFDKSTLEGLSVDESVLLDHFYRANIPPIFFVECLADLEFEIKRRKRMTGTPEQLVASLAERTPDSQSSVNMYHLRVLEEELAGRFDLASALARPLIAQGELVELGDSKGMIVRESEEEQAFRRWSRHEFFELERSEITVFLPVEASAGDGARLSAGRVRGAGRVRLTEIAGTEAAVAVHDGPAQDVDRTYAALGTAVAERAIGVDGPIREYYPDGFDPAVPHRTEICWPVFLTGAVPA